MAIYLCVLYSLQLTYLFSLVYEIINNVSTASICCYKVSTFVKILIDSIMLVKVTKNRSVLFRTSKPPTL